MRVWERLGTLCAVVIFLSAPATAFPVGQEAKPRTDKQTKEAAASQTGSPAREQSAEKPLEKGKWRLRFSKIKPKTISLRASEAPMREIASELGREFKVPVHLSPVMQQQNVTIEFSALPLDAALRMLAPQPYIDYEVGGDFDQPNPLAIYLHALNEPPPSLSAAVKNSSEAILIEGDTEEGVEGANAAKTEEQPLTVSFAKNQLSVRARKQPLIIVLYKVASALSVPFDLRHDSTEIVDIDFSNQPLDQAVRSLSPAIRFYYRTDLQTFETLPLRLALMAPAKS